MLIESIIILIQTMGILDIDREFNSIDSHTNNYVEENVRGINSINNPLSQTFFINCNPGRES